MTEIPRIRNLLLSPRSEWAAIAGQPTETRALYTGHVAPLAAIGPICGFVGLSPIGIDLPMLGHYRAPLVSGLAHALVGFVLTLVGVFVLAQIIDSLAPRFAAQRSQAQALKLAAYAATPAWLAGVFQLLPALSLLGLLASLYSLYLLYLGLPVLMKSPKERAGAYTLAVIVAAVVVALLIGAVASLVQPSTSHLGGLHP
jgi:tetrahydromethanopterin S-methyltransferase subunit C